MVRKGTLLNLGQTLKQFKYPALILCLGLALVLFPTGKKQEKIDDLPPPVEEQCLEEQMEDILSCIDGAGRVRVLLTKRTGDETLYQSDEVITKNADNESTTRTTVLTRKSGGSDAPVVRQTVFARYRGALIVCEGADSAQVRLQLVNAVASLTGLSTDRITVIKMKG